MDKIPGCYQAMMNSLALMIEGYDDDPREIYAIPEVRTGVADYLKVNADHLVRLFRQHTDATWDMRARLR